MPTTAEEFQCYLESPEGARIELKEASQNFHFEKLIDYCVALANEGGGKIILGASDCRPRRVVGTAAFAEPGRTEAGIFQKLHRRVPVEEYQFDDRRVLIFHVPSRLPGTAWDHDGRYLRRVGDNVATIESAELQAMLSEAGPDYSAQPS